MKIDLDDTVASVQEVSAFAWSLTELLFTRILPLLGFVVAQLLLQAGRAARDLVTVSSSSSPPSARRRSLNRRPSWLSYEQPSSWPALAQPCLPSPTYSPTQATQYVDSSLIYCEPSSPSTGITPRAEIAGNPDLPESIPLVASSQEATVGSGGLKETQLPASLRNTLAASQDREQPQPTSAETAIGSLESFATHSTDAQTAENHVLEKPVLAEASPTAAIVSDEQERQGEGGVPPPAAQSAHAVQSTPSDTPEMTQDASRPSQCDRYEASEPSDAELIVKDDGPQRLVIEPDCQKAEAMPRSASKRRQFTRRKSLSQTKRHPFAKVLPPSLSQIKRTIMQRSRRG